MSKILDFIHNLGNKEDHLLLHIQGNIPKSRVDLLKDILEQELRYDKADHIYKIDKLSEVGEKTIPVSLDKNPKLKGIKVYYNYVYEYYSIYGLKTIEFNELEDWFNSKSIKDSGIRICDRPLKFIAKKSYSIADLNKYDFVYYEDTGEMFMVNENKELIHIGENKNVKEN